MSALEQEIYEKFQQLDEDAKRRVREHLNTEKKPFDWRAWFERIDAINAEMHAEEENHIPIDVVGLLRQIREEDASVMQTKTPG